MAEGTWQSRGAKGAASELIACAHLMRQGWHVFRCESPASPFDLVAYRDGEFLRVEVKSISRVPLAKTRRSPDPRMGVGIPWPSNDEWDLLIAVEPDEGDCFEITTHDQREGIDLLRVHYGHLPVAEMRSVQWEGRRVELREMTPLQRRRHHYPNLAAKGLI